MKNPTLASLTFLLTAVPMVPLGAQGTPDQLLVHGRVIDRSFVAPGPQSEPEARGTALARARSLGILRVPIHTAADDPIGGPYGIWAAGATYKVSFHGDMTFVPFLGRDYPHNQPLSWRTTSFRIGGTELLASGEQAERQKSEYRYEYRYRHFVEAYDVLDPGIEQTFVLHERPATQGELVVTGRIDSAMTAPRHDRGHQSIVFADHDGRELVRYGEAFAVDAAGRKITLESAHEDGQVQLFLPAAFLDEAVYPLVIDPLVNVTTLSSSSRFFGSPDIVYDEEGRDYMITFTRSASGTDEDGFALLVDHDFTGATTAFADFSADWSTEKLAVACAHQPRKYAVVFSRHFVTRQARVRFHIHDGGDFSLRNTVSSITPPAGAHDWRPDVGGTILGPNGKWVMLVFQRDRTGSGTWANVSSSEIVALPVDVSGATPAPGFEIPIAQVGPTGSFDNERPSINQVARASSPLQTTWVVAFQTYWNDRGAPDDWDVYARQVSSSGTQSTSLWFARASGSDTDHRLGPQVAGSHDRYGIAYTQEPVNALPPKPTGISGRIVAFERFDWPVSGSPIRYDQVDIISYPSPLWRVGGCSHDYASRSHWAFTTAGGNPRDAYIDKVGFRGQPLERARIRSNSPLGIVPGGIDYLRVPQFTTVWCLNALTQANSVQLGELAYNQPTPWSTTGPGCSPATIEWTSSIGSTSFRHIQQIGHGYTQIRVSGAPPSAIHFMLVALGTASINMSGIPGVGTGCWLLVPGSGPDYVGILDSKVGADVRWDLPLPENLGPVTVHFQDWHLSASGSALQSTERLTVELIR